MVAQSFNPSPWEGEAGGALCFEPNLVDMVSSKPVVMRGLPQKEKSVISLDKRLGETSLH